MVTAVLWKQANQTLTDTPLHIRRIHSWNETALTSTGRLSSLNQELWRLVSLAANCGKRSEVWGALWKRAFKRRLCYVLWRTQKLITPTQPLAYKLHTTPSWVTTRTLTLAVQIRSLQNVPSHWPHPLTIHFLILKASPLPRKVFVDWWPRQKIYCKPSTFQNPGALECILLPQKDQSEHVWMGPPCEITKYLALSGLHNVEWGTSSPSLSSYNPLLRGQHCELRTCQPYNHAWASPDMSTMGQEATPKPHGEGAVTGHNQNSLPPKESPCPL